MGIVNEYITKLINKIRPSEIDKPWLKNYEKMVDHLDYYNGSLYDYVKDTAQKYPDNTACTYYGKTFTYKKFIKMVDKVAESLSQFNIVENECVTICMPNTPEAIFLVYAINKIGAIANIVHPLGSRLDIERALEETNSQIIFFTDVTMSKIIDIKVKNAVFVPVSNSLSGIKKMVYNSMNSINFSLKDNMISWDEFLNKKQLHANYVMRSCDEPAAIIYSGGTTGKCKGIILSNRNFNTMARQTSFVCEYIKPGNSVLAALPIFHVFGLALCVHTCLVAGMNCILVPKLDTKHINKELKKYKPTVFTVVPSLLNMILNDKDPGKHGFSNTKVVVCGGDYLPNETRIKAEKYFKEHGSDLKVLVGYGLSEVTGFCCCTAMMDSELDSIGIPNPDIDIKIFEPNTDVELPYGEIGEICISGPTLMLGYINEEGETASTLVKHSDGKIWLHSGDLGYMSKKGALYYTSRIKRMIISNGYNIYPNELEEIINKCEYVDVSTVVGIPHKIKGYVPKAVIVLKKGVENTATVRQEIKKYCMQNIAKYAQPYDYEYRDSLPKTAVGKIAYRELGSKK